MEDTGVFKKSFFKKSRRGKILKLVREKYLREDIECGYMCGKPLSEALLFNMVSSAPHQHLLVVDTNVALHQIDVLEYSCPATSLVVILQTVLQELRNLNLPVYRRLAALIQDESRSYIFFPNEQVRNTALARMADESMNDFNDRSIRVAVKHFGEIIANHTERDQDSSCQAVLLSNDAENLRRAEEEDLYALAARQYVHTYLQEYPELLDLLAHEDTTGGRLLPSQRENLFPAHESMDTLLRGIKNKKYHRGVLRCKAGARGGDRDECYVVVHSAKAASGGKKDKSVEERWSVTISGPQCVNRALDGDIVAVEVMAPSAPNRSLATATARPMVPSHGPARAAVSMADVTAEASVEAIEGLATSSVEEQSGVGALPICGRVVGIIRRNWRQYAGAIISTDGDEGFDNAADSLKSANEDAIVVAAEDASEATVAVFVPVDPKIPRVKITTRRIDELRGKKILVAIDQWPVWSEFPIGHYVRILGDDGSKAVETQVLLHEFGVPYESFTNEVMACLPPKTWRIDDDVISKRTDIRHIPVVSIDPPGCKDIDDALHCRALPNGNLEVGVHIADVSYFVKPDSPLDKEAAHRSTSTYLVERRLDMLPSLLTTELCSLRSTEDHLAFSVVWEMDHNAKIVDATFFRSVIRSVASLTYDEAQAMLDSPDPDPAEEDEDEDKQVTVLRSVKNLNKLAKQLRSKRIEEGALTLASPEVRFKFDGESDNPTDVSVYNIKESNQLVEEFMLLANITVSKKILRHFPTLGVLRRHQPPSQEQFAPLLSAANAVGVHLDISTSRTLADSLDRAQRKDDPFFNKLLRILSTRCMMPAQYFCSGELPKDQWHHYGLAAPVYTHFTSPIRRYADLVVHRLLSAAIGDTALPPSNADRTKQQELCSHMNRRHRSAQHIQRASTALHTILYFRGRPAVEPAYVLSVLADRVSIIVPKFGIEGSLLLRDIVGENFANSAMDISLEDFIAYDAPSHSVTIKDQSKNNTLLRLQVFQQVHVRIEVEEAGAHSGSRRLTMALVINYDGSTKTVNQCTGRKRELQEFSPSAERESATAMPVQGNSSSKKNKKLRKGIEKRK